MYCMCISITCTVAGVGILCIVCVSLSHARWQVMVYYVLNVYLYHMHGGRCWYIMYCMFISITCTVAGVGILCIECVSLSHARWQVLVYYVLYVYLYHMHGGRCWYIMYCMCISITCTVAGVYLHRYLIRTSTAVQYIELSNMNMFAVFVKSLLCY